MNKKKVSGLYGSLHSNGLRMTRIRSMSHGDNKCPEENKGRMNRMGGDGVGDSLPTRRLGKASSVRWILNRG